MIYQSQKLPWSVLRSAVVADDTLLTTFDYESMPTAKMFSLSLDYNMARILAYGKAAENKDVLYKLWARGQMNGPLVLLATGIMTLGSEVVTKDPITKAAITAYWVDTITITGGILADDSRVIRDSGANRKAMLRFDTEGFKDIFLEIDLDGGSSAMTEFNAIISGV